MFYTLKRPTEIDWFDLFQLEHPDRAIDLITQMCGPRFQGQSIMQLISGLDKLCPDGHINPHVVESALRSGEFFLVPFSDAQSPMLRQAITFHTDSGQNNPTKSEWLLSSNTFSDHLTSTLHYLIDQTPKPIFVSAAVRQNAKAGSAATTPAPKQQKQKEPEKFWLKIQSIYDDKWKTPLPLTVQVLVDGVVIESGLELSKGAGKSSWSSNLKSALKTQGEPGTVVLEDIPVGNVEVIVERVTGLEQSIASLKKKLRTTLDLSLIHI